MSYKYNRIAILLLFVCAFCWILTPIIGMAADTDSYTITVPAKLSANETGNVILSGTWASNKTISITADSTVTITNSINASETMTINVTFNGISSSGNNSSQTITEPISVENVNVLFGTWTGVINYNVTVEEKEATVTVEGLGDVTVSDPNAQLTFNATSNKLLCTVLPNNGAAETPSAIPEENLPELIEFGYGTFESNAIYNPEEYETIEYTTTGTRLKPPVGHVSSIFASYSSVTTTDENGNSISVFQADEPSLSQEMKLASRFIAYTYTPNRQISANGIEGKPIGLCVIMEDENDTLENAIYLAAYYNKRDNTDSYHVAYWNGTQYVDCGVDEQIANVEVFTETYTITETKEVVISSPSYSTEYVYLPVGTLKAVSGMTWSEWLASEFNILNMSEVIIRNSDYEIINPVDEIIAGENYSFVDAPPVDYDTILPGLYKSGSNYTEMIMDWETLINDGWLTVKSGELNHTCDNSSKALCSFGGDLVLSSNAGITSIFGSNSLAGVTGIFSKHTKLTSIIIPEGVTEIKAYAFEGCSNLSKIVLPHGLRSFGETVFAYTNLTEIKLPETVTSFTAMYLGGTFTYCTNLKYIEIPESITTIGQNLFIGCSSLETVVLPSSITSIATTAFSDCYSLKTINIPSTVTRIPKDTFRRCFSLSNVTFEGDAKWYYTESDDYTNGIEIDVSDPATAASLLIKYSDKYLYSENDAGGGDDGPCVTPETLITLADGTTKRIDETTYEDEFLVWDFVNGCYTTAPASIIMNHGENNYDVVTLNFSDGTTINTINGHGFFNVNSNKFVIINKDNVVKYVGKDFVKQTADGYTTVQLANYVLQGMKTESWSILTSEHYNCILEGLFTITPAEVENSPDYLMPFVIGANMKYLEAEMQADIDKYGLYTYEDFAHLLTEEEFLKLNLPIFKVSVGKEYISLEEILLLIKEHFG